MDNLTIVHHNTLVESSYRLDLDEMRLLNLALTKVDPREANIGVIEIYPNEFSEMFRLNKKNIWRNMKKALVSIMTKPITIEFLDSQGKKKKRLISWLSSAEYFTKQSDGSRIQLNFTDDVIPYLCGFDGNFTKVNFEYIRRLNTPFSFRLYIWLKREFQMKKGGYYERIISIEEIKKKFGFTVSNYPKWQDFKSSIIQPAVDAINSRTNFSVNYSVIIRAKKIYALTFTYIDEVQKGKSEFEKNGSYVFPTLKPIRPKLLRRPNVIVGSHEEGEWQRKNLKTLSQYSKDLILWDPSSKLTMSDLRKIVSYSKIFDPILYEKMNLELLKREGKLL